MKRVVYEPHKRTIVRRKRRVRVGIVKHMLSGSVGTETAAIAVDEFMHQIESGLPLHDLELLRQGLGVTQSRLVELLSISKATFQRRKASSASRLTPLESDRVVRFARLLSQATSVFESSEAARSWLSSPQFGLGGAIPLDFARTEVGAREVENLLGRIEHSVYS